MSVCARADGEAIRGGGGGGGTRKSPSGKERLISGGGAGWQEGRDPKWLISVGGGREGKGGVRMINNDFAPANKDVPFSSFGCLFHFRHSGVRGAALRPGIS